MKYSKIQYISQGKSLEEQEKNIKNALENGADWIQVRWKNVERSNLFYLSENAVRLCRQYGALCIINDAVDIVEQIDADGVHLGLDDEDVKKAREILGTGKIIGGTANTLEDVQKRIDDGCDYIGLGPFRFTATKEKLSPTLDVAGYRNIIQALAIINKSIPPIYAIGGIEIADLDALKKTGVYGIALSRTLTKQPQLISKIKDQLK